MNSPPTGRRSPLRCRFTRMGISLCGENGIFARHVASCPDCRRVVQAGHGLESALRRDALRSRREPPIGLERRILQAVAAAPRTETPFRAPRYMLGVAALAAIVLAFVVRESPMPGDLARDTVRASEADAAATIEMFKTFSNRLLSAVETPPTLVTAANPLRQEIDSVYSDARFALGFLALNFLPSRADVAPNGGRAGG